MGPSLPSPDEVEAALVESLRARVLCKIDGDALELETPYVLQDGHLLRVYIELTTAGLSVSDGGFTQRQLETDSRTAAMLRERVADVQRIATQLSLKWDGELSYEGDNLGGVLERLAVLCRAVDRSLSLLGQRPTRKAADVRSRLRDQLVGRGFAVTSRGRPQVKGGLRPVVVDQLVRKNGTQAAVEILTSRTESGAHIAVDRAATNFQVLNHFDYQGPLIAVYDRDSPAAEKSLRDRFEAAKPKVALLVSDDKAAEIIGERLAS